MGLFKRVLLALCVTASLTLPACALARPSVPAILIIDDSDRDSSFSHRFREQFHLTLDATTTQHYILYTEYLDLAHFSGPNYEAALQSYFAEKYRNRPISLIVALGAESLKFSADTLTNSWHSVPIVFATFNGASENRYFLSKNATGIIAEQTFENLVRAARFLVPNLARLAVVGEPPGRQPFRPNYLQDIQQIKGRLGLIDLIGRPFDEVKRKIATLPDNAAIAYLPIYSDKSGTIHNPGEALEALTKVANRPIVADSTSFIGKGATGGFVLSPRDLGRQIAKRVARILGGVPPSRIPITVEDIARPIFDAQELKKWGISESALPPNSELRFWQPTPWERYRWEIIAALVVILMQGLIIIWLLIERRRRFAAQRESRQHLLEATQMDRALTAGAMSASIAHELNQPLSAILNNAEAAEALLNADLPDQDELKEILADIRRDDQRATDIIKHLRILLKKSDLNPEEIDLVELIKETVGLLEPQAMERGITIKVDPLPATLSVCADRVHIQQVLLNLAMNAIEAMQTVPPTQRLLRLQAKKKYRDVIVSVSDTGWGIPVAKLKNIFQPFVTTKQEGTGLGLAIAQTIIAAHGGTIWAENATAGGAIFCFSLRLAHAQKRSRRANEKAETV